MRPVVITTSWDDGHPLDLRVAELLAANGLAGTFYVPRFSERGVMSEGQVRQLASRFEIGAHTLHHVPLTRLDDVTARAEIVDSRAWVRDVCGQACTMFCPPLGRFGRRELALAREAGYGAVRTVEFLSVDWPVAAPSGLLVMPTTIQAYPHGAGAYVKNGLKRLGLRALWRYVGRGLGRDWEALAASMLDLAAAGGGVFHLWGHSWELEEAGQWGRLEQVLRLLGQLGGGAQRLSNGQVCAPCEPGAFACSGAHAQLCLR